MSPPKSQAYPSSLEGKHLPTSVWHNGMLCLPQPLIDAHQKRLQVEGWMNDYLSLEKKAGIVGGSTKEEAQEHFVLRFLNSAARAQFVCSDPTDSQPDIRDMILDQLAGGSIFILDIAAGNGAGTLAILSLLCELREKSRIPKFPLNIRIMGVDYSPDALVFYQYMVEEINTWLAKEGIVIELDSCVCDLKAVSEFSGILDQLFNEASSHKVGRFLCVLSAISGLGKDGLEEIHKSLEIAAIRLSSKNFESSWLWIEPSVQNSWLTKFANLIKFALQRVHYFFSKKNDSYEVSSKEPLLPNPIAREFKWQDPYKTKIITSRVMVFGFKND